MKNLMYRVVFVLVSIFICSFVLAETKVTNTFSAKTPAKASEINKNFEDLAVAIDETRSNAVGAIKIMYRNNSSTYSSDSVWLSQVVSASCNNDEILVGGGCRCGSLDTNSSTTNFGSGVVACAPAGRAYAGYCQADFTTADTNKYGPGFSVYVNCLSLVDVNGEDLPITPIIASKLKMQQTSGSSEEVKTQLEAERALKKALFQSK